MAEMVGHVRPTRRAGWLPGARADDVACWEPLIFGEGDQSIEVQVPRLAPAALAALIHRAQTARDEYLAKLPLDRIVTLLDRVASRWLDPASPYRREAEGLLPVITGYAEPAVRKGLPGLLGLMRQENLWRFLEEELVDPRALDGFVPRGAGGGETRAFGPRLTTHIWSGNVPGLPAQSLVNALLAKSASIGKVASEEPLFATLLAESIAEVDPRLAECLVVAWWPGGETELEAVAFEHADAIIAYGGERAIEALRGRAPASARFISHGHKLSFGVIGREALTPEALPDTAARAAYDVAKYDQQGCLSPHLIYAETGGVIPPLGFAEALGNALARYEGPVPGGRISVEEAASAAAARQRHERRVLAGEPAAMFEGQGWAVLYDEDPVFQASCLNRTVYVKPVADLLVDVPALVEPARKYLQSCGVAAPEGRRRALAEQLGRLGLDRVCPLGRMGDVAPTWHHDGRSSLLDLLRWTDLEPESSAGRWEFSNPHLGLYGRRPDAVEEGEADGTFE